MYKYVLSFFLTVGLSVSSLGATKAVMVDAATNEIVVPTVTDLFAEGSDNIAAIHDALGMDDLASLLTFDSVRYPGVTTVSDAILELAVQNPAGVNAADGTSKVHWSQIYGVSLVGLGEGVPMYFNGSEVVDTWGLNFIDSDSITVTKTTVTDAPYAVTFDLVTGYKDFLDSLSLASSGAMVSTNGINTPFVGSIDGAEDYIVLTPLIKGEAPTANTPVVILNGPTERTDYGFGIADGYEVKGRVRPNSIHITGNINAPESQYPIASLSYDMESGIRLYNNVLISGQVPRELGASPLSVARAPSLSLGPSTRINFLTYVEPSVLDPISIQQYDLTNVGWSISQTSSASGTVLRIGRYSPTTSYADAMTITTLGATDGVVKFTNTPTAEGYPMWHAGNDGASSGLDADTVRGLQPNDLFVLGDNVGGMVATQQVVTGKKVFTRQMFDYHKRKKILNPNGGNAAYTNTRDTTVNTYIKIVLPSMGLGAEPLNLRMQISAKTNTGEFNFELQGDSQLVPTVGFVPTPNIDGGSGFPAIRYTLKTFDGSIQSLMVYQAVTTDMTPRPALLIGPFLMSSAIQMHVNVDNIEIFTPQVNYEHWTFGEDFEVSFYEDISDVIQTSGNFYAAGLQTSSVDDVHVTPLIDLDTARKFFVANPITQEKTSSFTAEPNHVYAVSSSSAITVTLPRIINLSFLEKNQEIIIQNLGTGVVTLNRSGTDTLLDSLNSYSLGRYDSVVLRPNFRYGPTSISTWLIY